MELSYEDVLTILRLIDESHYGEMRLELGDLRLYVRKRGETGATVGAGDWRLDTGEAETRAEARAETKAETRPIREGLVAVRAPMLGTFYRAPSPEAEPFCEVGDLVEANDTLCLIEVMKLFNSISAGVAGRVVEFSVENGALVEYAQPLVLIEPSEVPRPAG